jgi:hypothetical protein
MEPHGGWITAYGLLNTGNRLKFDTESCYAILGLTKKIYYAGKLI